METLPARLRVWHGCGRFSDRQRTGNLPNTVDGTIYNAKNADSGPGCCLATPDDESDIGGRRAMISVLMARG